MQQAIIAIPTHRGFADESVKESVRLCVRSGAELKLATEISDIAGGRSWLLTETLEAAEGQGRDVVLCIDDDIQFRQAQAQLLIDHARATGIPCSGVYVTRTGNLAGKRHRPFRHLMGLGFCAIPTAALRAVAGRVPYVRFGQTGKRVYEFCRSGANVEADWWHAEDYHLSSLLGGFQLLPVAVGHFKMLALTPHAEDVESATSWENHVSSYDGPPTERGT